MKGLVVDKTVHPLVRWPTTIIITSEIAQRYVYSLPSSSAEARESGNKNACRRYDAHAYCCPNSDMTPSNTNEPSMIKTCTSTDCCAALEDAAEPAPVWPDLHSVTGGRAGGNSDDVTYSTVVSMPAAKCC